MPVAPTSSCFTPSPTVAAGWHFTPPAWAVPNWGWGHPHTSLPGQTSVASTPMSSMASSLGPVSITPLPECTAAYTVAYSSFSYTQMTSAVYPTPITTSLTFSTYAPAFSAASTLLPNNVTYTSYSLNRDATTTNDGTYGQSAYAALWAGTTYSSTLPFTTTASPTPVASSELVLPPALYTACPASSEACLDCYKLPSDFIVGVAGSANQIEGGLQFGGRGPSALDSIGLSGSANDSQITDMNYFLYKQDIVRLAAIGVKYYSFSVSWTRILPFGTAGTPINEPGLAHYDDVINTCIQYGITPVVTLLHFDTPRSVNTSNVAEFRRDFLNYAKIVMTHYADRVPIWATINEPNLSFFYPGISPFISQSLAHADVYHWYKEELKGTGRITIKFANNLALPFSSAEDISAALRYQDFIVGIMGLPLFRGLQIPNTVLSTVGWNMPYSAADLAYLNGTVDFLSVDPYVSQFAAAAPNGISNCAANVSDPLYPNCVVLTNVQEDGWLMGQKSNGYAYIAPQYVRQQLGYLWNTFQPNGILISEFGFNPFADAEKVPVAQRYDLERTLYYQEFLREMLKAMFEDNVKVIGTLAWSALDNNEFGSFDDMYGLQMVNRTNGLFTRTYKRSFFDYMGFFEKFQLK